MTASERTWCGYPEAHSAAYYEHLRLSRYARQAMQLRRFSHPFINRTEAP